MKNVIIFGKSVSPIILLLLLVSLTLMVVYTSNPFSGLIGTSATINSVSKTTLNGQDAILVDATVGTGGDIAQVSFSKSNIDNQINKEGSISFTKVNSKYNYFMTTRVIGNSIMYYDPQPAIACHGTTYSFGWFDLGTQRGQSCNTQNDFDAACKKADMGYGILEVKGGDAYNPDFKCFVRKPYILVADFDQDSSFTSAGVFTDLAFNDGQVIHAETSNNKQVDVLKDTDTGEVYGEVYMNKISSRFVDPIPAGSFKAIVSANAYGPALPWQIVPDYATTTTVTNAETNFNTQLLSACTGTSGLFKYNCNMGAVDAALNSFKNALDAIQQVPAPNGLSNYEMSYNGQQRILSIDNQFSFPEMQLKLYASKLGITRANAIPTSISCNKITVPGGQSATLGVSISASSSGIVYYDTQCTNGVTALTGSGSIQASFSPNQFNVMLFTPAYKVNSTCSITAHSTDLKTDLVKTCDVVTTGACEGVAIPDRFILNTSNCIPYCPLDKTSCGGNQSFNSVKCLCEGFIPPICTAPMIYDGARNVCVNPSCPIGQMFDSQSLTCMSDSIKPPQCLPLIQKLQTDWQGGLVGIGSTPVYSCTTDWIAVGVASIVSIIFLTVLSGAGISIVYLVTRRKR